MLPQEHINNFIKHLLEEKAYNAGTVGNYRYYVEGAFAFFGSIGVLTVEALTTEHVELFKKHLLSKGLSKKTVNYHLNGLRMFLKFLIKKKFTVLNPFDVEKYNHIVDAEIVLLPKGQLETFLNTQLNPMSDLVANMLFGTGLRIFELHQIQIENINFEMSSISILGKGNKRRVIYMTDRAQNLLMDYISSRRETERTGPIFLNSHGEPMTIRWLQKIIEVRRDALLPKGTKLSPHMLRHHYATNLLNRGMKLPVLQKLLGHASIMTTNRYLHYTDDEIKSQFDEVINNKK